MSLNNTLNIVIAKHVRSCTEITQSRSVGPHFKCIESFNKTTTFKNLPEVLLKENPISSLCNLHRQEYFHMKLTACKALIDQVVSAPDIMTQALHIKNTRKGSQENEMSDTNTGFILT